MKKPKTAIQLSSLACAIVLALTACNSTDSISPSTTAQATSIPETCTVKATGETAVISCPDGTSASITDGAQGLGSGISATTILAEDSRCLQGNGGVEYTTFTDENNTGVFAPNDTVTSVNYVCNGATGAQGATGASGASSMIGLTAAGSQACATGGWLITVTNGTNAPLSYPVCNGATGATGATGAAAPVSPLTLTQLIAPCGLASSAWKEELMLFSDGTLLADFSSDSSGDDTRLSLIPDGTYEDTDESGCVFTIATSGNTRSISWNAGTSSDDPSGWAAGGQSWTLGQ